MHECNVLIHLFSAIFTLWVKQGKYKNLNNMKGLESDPYFQEISIKIHFLNAV